mmetsp:Transcript_50219/g.98271  ORF Transcript_50219/g.98271 Transcript_50219/m.98271 type:complete len:138 (+) Transcript_50219:2985-3398(+)
MDIRIMTTGNRVVAEVEATGETVEVAEEVVVMIIAVVEVGVEGTTMETGGRVVVEVEGEVAEVTTIVRGGEEVVGVVAVGTKIVMTEVVEGTTTTVVEGIITTVVEDTTTTGAIRPFLRVFFSCTQVFQAHSLILRI